MDQIYNKKYSAGYIPWFFEKTYEKVLSMILIDKKDKILEIGCGGGYFIEKLKKLSDNVFGIDVNEDAIKLLDPKNCFIMSAERIDFKDEYFDKIFSFHTLEHIPDLNKVFFEMSRILAKNGKIVLVYPCEPFRGLFEIRSSIRIYGHPFDSRKFHLHLLNSKKIRQLAEEAGLKELKSGRLWTIKYIPWPQYFSILGK
jgi:SAM-dependent methyltransferase